jgi:hypothetical protein
VDPDTGDIIVSLLADVLGPVEVIAIGPVRSPLPITGHCSRCGSSTVVYGPAGSPLCDQCRNRPASLKLGEPAPNLRRTCAIARAAGSPQEQQAVRAGRVN